MLELISQVFLPKLFTIAVYPLLYMQKLYTYLICRKLYFKIKIYCGPQEII